MGIGVDRQEDPMKRILLFSLLVVLSVGCKKKAEDDSDLSVDPVEASVESGLTMVSGMADDQAGTAYALNSKPEPASIWKIILGEKAYAATCQRALYASCSGGVRSANYNQCDIMGTAANLYGQVSLTYSDAACSMAANGNTVTRTYNIEINGPRGGQISHSSDNRSDYRGTSYGGGGRLTKTASGWNAEILGRNSVLSFRGRTIFDVSVRTLSAMGLTGSLSRSSRVLSGGQLEINHNVAGFTAIMSPTNLQWNNTCCHPVSGSLSVTYSGSKTGNATVTFSGCGSASVNQGGQVSTINMSYCE